MEVAEEIKKLVEQKLTPEQFLVDIVISAKKGPKKVMVIVDGDNGFNIDDCAELSRFLSKSLDESGLIDDNYLLEVSTPGVDHPLKLKRQYVKNIGRSLKVKLLNKVVEGKLTGVEEDAIVLTQETGTGKKKVETTARIPFIDIEKAFVLISFK